MFGDVTLFIRHQRSDEDIALEPTWAPYYSSYGNTGDAHPIVESVLEAAKSKCPFSYLF